VSFICCGTCRLYNKNAKNFLIRDNVCLCGKNKQLTVYQPQYFTPHSISFMCEQWLDENEGEL